MAKRAALHDLHDDDYGVLEKVHKVDEYGISGCQRGQKR